MALGIIGINPAVRAAHPTLPAADVRSLIALIRANPGTYSYGSGGVGSVLHLCGEQFKARAGGLNIVRVPYRGSAPMIGDLAGGQLPLAFDLMATVWPHIRAGRVRAIANGGPGRSAQLPDLPALAEQGLDGFVCYAWGTILAPAKTPAPVIAALHRAVVRALDDQAVARRLRGHRDRGDPAAGVIGPGGGLHKNRGGKVG